MSDESLAVLSIEERLEELAMEEEDWYLSRDRFSSRRDAGRLSDEAFVLRDEGMDELERPRAFLCVLGISSTDVRRLSTDFR